MSRDGWRKDLLNSRQIDLRTGKCSWVRDDPEVRLSLPRHNTPDKPWVAALEARMRSSALSASDVCTVESSKRKRRRSNDSKADINRNPGEGNSNKKGNSSSEQSGNGQQSQPCPHETRRNNSTIPDEEGSERNADSNEAPTLHSVESPWNDEDFGIEDLAKTPSTQTPLAAVSGGQRGQRLLRRVSMDTSASDITLIGPMTREAEQLKRSALMLMARTRSKMMSARVERNDTKVTKLAAEVDADTCGAAQIEDRSSCEGTDDQHNVNNRNGCIDGTPSPSRSMESGSEAGASSDSWTLGVDEDERQDSFRATTLTPDLEISDEIVAVARRYNMRARGPTKTYYDRSETQILAHRPAGKRKAHRRNSVSCPGAIDGVDARRQSTHQTQSRNDQAHDCPCHNLEICINMLRDVGEEAIITKVKAVGKAPGMTARVLAALYPEAERLDDLDLLCHRVIMDEDQAVHETAPYAFFLNGWPRGKYCFSLNRMARAENMDVVEDQIEFLLQLFAPASATVAAPEVIDLTGIDDRRSETFRREG